jgi:hypothetical protein
MGIGTDCLNPSYETAIATHGDIPKTLPGTTLSIATKTLDWVAATWPKV